MHFWPEVPWFESTPQPSLGNLGLKVGPPGGLDALRKLATVKRELIY